MNLSMLNTLEKSVNSINAIVALELATKKVVAENQLAQEYFASIQGATDFVRLLGPATNSDEFVRKIKEALKRREKVQITGAHVMGKTGERLECDMTFSYITPEHTHVFMKVRPKIDNKPYYMEKFVETRRRPAFTLNFHDDVKVNYGNEIFFQSFACTKETMGSKYNNLFSNLLSTHSREEDLATLRRAVREGTSGILDDVSLQTARGDRLWVYFNKNKLKQVEPDTYKNLFCLLVDSETTEEELENPFDK